MSTTENFVMGCTKDEVTYSVIKQDNYATMHIDGYVPRVYHEFKPVLMLEDKRRENKGIKEHKGEYMDSTDFGPQRWAILEYDDKFVYDEMFGCMVERDHWCGKLEFIESEIVDSYEEVMDTGWYVCPVCKRQYLKEETYSRLPSKTFTCRKLDSTEKSWLEANKGMFKKSEYLAYTRKIDEDTTEDEETMLEYKDELFSAERMSVVSGAPTSTEKTGMCLPELRFWRKMIWDIGHNPKGAVRFCKDLVDPSRIQDDKKRANFIKKWDTEDISWFKEVSYYNEEIVTKKPRGFKEVSFQEKKQYIWELLKDEDTKDWKYMKVLMMKAKKFRTRYIEEKYAHLYPKPVAVTGDKVFNVHVFYSRDNLKKGFVNYWAVLDGRIKGFDRVDLDGIYKGSQMKGTDASKLISSYIKRAKAAGYRVEVINVVKACKSNFAKVPMYSKVRRMGSNYATSTMMDLL